MLYDDWLDILERQALIDATDELERTPALLGWWLHQHSDDAEPIEVPTADDLSACTTEQLIVVLWNAPETQAMRARHILRERFADDHGPELRHRVAELVDEEIAHAKEDA